MSLRQARMSCRDPKSPGAVVARAAKKRDLHSRHMPSKLGKTKSRERDKERFHLVSFVTLWWLHTVSASQRTCFISTVSFTHSPPALIGFLHSILARGYIENCVRKGALNIWNPISSLSNFFFFFFVETWQTLNPNQLKWCNYPSVWSWAAGPTCMLNTQWKAKT